LRDAFKSLSKQGVCAEIFWRYLPKRFAEKPNFLSYWFAKKQAGIVYESVAPNELAIRSAIAQNKTVVCGIYIFESFESERTARTGIVKMPDKSEKKLGGHAIRLCGYNVFTKQYTAANSWGQEWGQNGYFQIPFSYIHEYSLAFDFWTLSA
jgi:hypothetical protein